MEIGFIGLGKMGFPMARRLIEAGHQLTVSDQRREAIDKLVALGAQAAGSPTEVVQRRQTREDVLDAVGFTAAIKPIEQRAGVVVGKASAS
jgi:3-hydroxyisobutyrate dehydrogenase-like beta-hydroxyacid dehydrogenase